MLRYPETRVCLISYLLMYVSVHTDPKNIAQSLLVGVKYSYWVRLVIGRRQANRARPLDPELAVYGFYAQPQNFRNFDTTTPSNLRVGCRLPTKLASIRASLWCANRANGSACGRAHVDGFNRTKEARP